jgi:type III secretion system YscQ/HrcQ family protein
MNQALSLPAIDAEGITLLNQLFRLSHQLYSLGRLPAPLIPSFVPSSAQTAKTKLELNWDNFPIYLYFDTSLNELANTLLPSNITLSSLGEDIALALFEKALLTNYSQLLDSPLHLQKIEDTSSIPEDCYTLQWQPGHPILRGQLCIEHHIAPALIHKLTQSLAPILSEQTPSTMLFTALPIPVRMELGELNLSLNEIKKLEKYDLLLPEKSYFAAGVMQLNLTASLGFTVKVEGNTCIVMTPLESYKAHMDNNENDFDDDFKRFLEDIPETSYGEALPEDHHEEEETPSDSASFFSEQDEYAASLDDVNIHLTFDVGHLELTLGELASITPGYTFNLAKSIHKAVTIRANGTVIGKGELVDIEGTIGVSIVELYQRGKG